MMNDNYGFKIPENFTQNVKFNKNEIALAMSAISGISYNKAYSILEKGDDKQ